MCTIGGLQKAYDSVHQQSVFNILKKFNFSNKLINLIEITLKNTEIKVKPTYSKYGPETKRCDVANVI